MGTKWLLDGRVHRVVRQLSPEKFVTLDEVFQREEIVTEAEILSRYAAGKLRFTSGTSTSELKTPARPAVIHDLSPGEQAEVIRRWAAIEPLTTSDAPPRRKVFMARSAELAAAGKRCSARSLRRFYDAWRRAGQDRMALAPRTAARGGRGQLRRHGIFGRDPRLRRLVDEAITAIYLTMARRPTSAVTRRVLEEIERANSRLTPQQALAVPKPAVLERAIRRRIARLDPWEIDRARWGRKIADRRHQPTTRQRLATRILERVEIDHCRLKVVVGNEAGPIGQPWLTVLVDYYSRLVTGFCLGFEPPSYGVVMEALRSAILPKTGVRERFAKLQHDWPCWGVPEKLVCDRGSDFISKDLEQAAFQLGITLDFTPPRTPHFKGAVESLFDTLNDELLSSLPGRTFRSWERRADYRPDEGPLMPYEALLEILHLHLIDVHAQGRHPTIGNTRLAVWQESAGEHPPLLPAAPEDLIVLLAKKVERTLSARGLELGGMFYTSNELMALRAELAAHGRGDESLQVRYNPWNLGQVWVLNPLDKQYLQASAVDRALEGLTEYQWRVLKRAVREKFDQPEHLLSIAASRNAIRAVAEAAINKPSGKRRLKAARFLAQHPPSQVDEPVLLTAQELINVEDDQVSDAGVPNRDVITAHPLAASTADSTSVDSEEADRREPPVDPSDWEVSCS